MIKPTLPDMQLSKPLSRGLRAWVPCHEGSGSTASDISGYGMHLTPGTAPTWADSRRGHVLSFNGSTHNLQSAKWPAYNPTSAITVACWIRGSSQDGKFAITHYDTGSNQRSWTLGSSSSAWSGGGTDKLGVIISQDGQLASNYKVYRSSAVVLDSIWHHVAFTFSAGTLKLYVDGGIDVHTAITDLSVSSLYDSTAALMLGAVFIAGAPSSYMLARIADVRIWGRALPQSEIARVAALPWGLSRKMVKPGTTPSVPFLAHYHRRQMEMI